MTESMKAESLAHLDQAERELKAAYVAGGVERSVFYRREFELHAQMSELSGTGPCACMACRQIREIEGGAEL